MRARPDFKKAAYEAAQILCREGLGDMILAFDYRVMTVEADGPAASKYGANFFTLPADAIVSAVVSGELPLE